MTDSVDEGREAPGTDPLPESLKRLDFEAVLEMVAGFAGSSAGRLRVASLRPQDDDVLSDMARDQALEGASLIRRGLAFPAACLDDLSDACGLLSAGILCAEPDVLRRTGEALRVLSSFADEAREAMGAEASCPLLRPLVAKLPDIPSVARELLRITTPDGGLSPDASPALSRLTRFADRLRDSLSREASRLADRLSAEGVLRDTPPSIRNGRFVLPVIAARRARVPGIVHDRSDTGGTIFVEPSSLSEGGNRLQEMTVELQQEQRRILRDATALLRREQAALEAGVEAGSELDCIFARGTYVIESCTTFPERGRFELRALRHPLLPRSEMVPNDISLPDDWRVLVVSGPNAGGKSVLLKSIGLAVACCRCGLGACAGDASTLPLLRTVSVSMGDSQSLAQKLSTYSARLGEELEMLRSAGDGMLVLLDEPSAGTDPLPGAAMAAALLESLSEAGCRVVVTTHLGQLKTLASDHPGYYNASMNFDESNLAPDYRFRFGIPGSSFAMEIAGRMGFPTPLLDSARALAGDAFQLDRIIADLSRTLEEVRGERMALEARAARFEALSEELEQLVKLQEETVAGLAEESRKRTGRFLKELESRADSLLARIGREDREAAVRARSEIRIMVSEVESSLPRAPEARTAAVTSAPGVGDWVRVRGWNGAGRIEELRGGSAQVRLGSMLVEAPLGSIEPAEAPPGHARLAEWVLESPSPEVDVRGMTSEEAVEMVDRRIDACVADGMLLVRVIHGKGRGVLMKAVTDYLRRDRRVASFGMAEPAEGGTGVTMVSLRSGG